MGSRSNWTLEFTSKNGDVHMGFSDVYGVVYSNVHKLCNYVLFGYGWGETQPPTVSLFGTLRDGPGDRPIAAGNAESWQVNAVVYQRGI